jgi:hypothetical protein
MAKVVVVLPVFSRATWRPVSGNSLAKALSTLNIKPAGSGKREMAALGKIMPQFLQLLSQWRPICPVACPFREFLGQQGRRRRYFKAKGGTAMTSARNSSSARRSRAKLAASDKTAKAVSRLNSAAP